MASYVEVALHPAQPLAGGCTERYRLLVINFGVVIQYRMNAAFNAAHSKFQVFYKACRAPAHFLQQLGLEAHARSAKEVRHFQVAAGQLPQTVAVPVRNAVSGRNPRIIRIFCIEIALNNLMAFAQIVVHQMQEVAVAQIVRIEHHDCVILARHAPQLFQHPLNRVAFALKRGVLANACIHAMAARNISGSVCAVVANDKNIIQLFWII
ncbi:hypothetical protein D3C84_850010 [compost metagenome]